MAKTQQNDMQNGQVNERPFLGLRSFEESNKSQFGGRDEEIQELFNLIDGDVLTVVFGKSGIGKTSLIKAGLMPELRENFYFPIYLRIDYSSAKSPLEQFREGVMAQIKAKDSRIADLGDGSLWEYFHNVKMLDGLVTPVIILDQFEEIFTLGDERAEDVNEFLVEVADLAENRIPLSVQNEYKRKNETVPAHFSELTFRVVFSLREDYLARLEEVKKVIPSIMNHRFRVVQMSILQAMDAAIKPGKGLIDESVARAIIQKLPGVSQSDFDKLDQGEEDSGKLKVEPFLLSLLCDRINEKRLEKKLDKFSIDLVSKFNVSDVINSFYEDTIGNYEKNVEHAIEERLLTEGGYRKLQSVDEMLRTYNISNEIIEELVDARILRKEMRDGVGYIELIHDVLAPVIKENRDIRHEQEREEERKAALREARQKNRRKIISIASTVGVVLLGVLAFAILTWRAKSQLELRRAQFEAAQNLLLEAENVKSYQGDYDKAASISRLAYLIHKQAKDKNSDSKIQDRYDEFFYYSMYASLSEVTEDPSRPFPPMKVSDDRMTSQDKKVKLKSFYYFDSSMNVVDSNAIYIPPICYLGHDDGSLRDNILTNSFGTSAYNSRFNFNTNEGDSTSKTVIRRYRPPFITSMIGLSHTDSDGVEHDLLGLAGTNDTIVFLNRREHDVYIKKAIPNYTRGGKHLEYTENGAIVLSQNQSLVRWNSLLSENAAIWEKRPESSFLDGAKSELTTKVYWGENILSIDKIDKDAEPDDDPQSEQFYSLSTYKDLIAVGIKGGVVLINDSSYIELKYEHLVNDGKRILAIKIDPTGEHIYLGDNKGDLFEVNLIASDDAPLYHLTEIKPRFHSERIVDIDANNDFVVAASWDGTVSVLNKHSKKQNKPFDLLMVDKKKNKFGKLVGAKFTKDGKYIVAGYETGTVLLWPTTIDIIEGLVCERIIDSLKPSVDSLRQYEIPKVIDLNDYRIECSNSDEESKDVTK